MSCRICGCTHERSCASGCGWAEADLCTVCQVIADAVLVFCCDPLPWKQLVERVTAKLEDTYADDLDDKRIRKALGDARARRMIDRGTGNLYSATPRGRRTLAKMGARLRREGLLVPAPGGP